MLKRASFIAGLLLAAFVSHGLAANERRVTAREAEAIAIALAPRNTLIHSTTF
jgi:hypothetical protein